MKIRQADIDECYQIAMLYQMAADGVADYIWHKIDPDQDDRLATGAKRYAREGVAFSYQNCQILETDETLVGMVMAFPMHTDPDYVEEDPILKPYAVLEEDNSLYISGVAVLPEHRGKGYGNLLMQEAERQAKQLGLGKMSLIVFEQNPAMRLYERMGYKERAREAIIPHPLIHCRGDAVLMVKTLAKQKGE